MNHIDQLNPFLNPWAGVAAIVATLTFIFTIVRMMVGARESDLEKLHAALAELKELLLRQNGRIGKLEDWRNEYGAATTTALGIITSGVAAQTRALDLFEGASAEWRQQTAVALAEIRAAVPLQRLATRRSR